LASWKFNSYSLFNFFREQLNFNTTTSTSYSTQIINYNITPPKGMAIGRIFIQHWNVTTTWTGTQASGNLLQVGTGTL